MKSVIIVTPCPYEAELEARLERGWRVAPTAYDFNPDERLSRSFGIALLLNKLLWFAHDTSSVPIVGRSYARSLIEWKLSKATGARIKQAYCAFSTDLSSSVVDDATLAALDMEKLARFKTDNADLLERHQIW